MAFVSEHGWGLFPGPPPVCGGDSVLQPWDLLLPADMRWNGLAPTYVSHFALETAAQQLKNSSQFFSVVCHFFESNCTSNFISQNCFDRPWGRGGREGEGEEGEEKRERGERERETEEDG